MLRRIIYFALPLLFVMSTPLLAQETAFGYARIARLYTEGWNGAQFDVMTPFYPLENVLISVNMTLRAKAGQRPENVVCSLRQDFRHVPADIHAVPGEDGGLSLSFDRLKAFTHLRFVVAWEDGRGQKAALTGAAIHAADTLMDWSRSADVTFGSRSRQNDATPTRIVITGPEDCRLL
jgi:hypothetical protein